MISRRESLKTIAGSAISAMSSAALSPTRLNILFILVDDWGWTDLGCYGSDFYETPHLDRLAKSGMRFTQSYAACPVCSPSRAAILTGKYPARLHITDWIPGYHYPHAKLLPPAWTQYLPESEATVADALKQQGYATISIGKWHLGGPPYYPDKHGFDRNIGGTEKGQPPSYFSPYRIPTLPDGPPGEYLTDRESSEAIKFVEANRARPFFLYLPHYAVHTPLQAKRQLAAKYERKVRAGMPQHNALYAAMIESVDENVGTLLGVLDKLGIAKRTVVFLTSDNGGLIQSTSNLPLRAGKGSAYEGGVRVPLMVRWPGVVRPGTQSQVPVTGVDFYPTFLSIAGIRPEKDRPVDGESLIHVLRGGGHLNRKAMFWHYPHYHPGGATPFSAIRENEWKLIEFHEDHRTEMYNLSEDIGEAHDLSAAMPRKAEKLRTRLHEWLKATGAQMPLPNPGYDPLKAKEH